MPDLKIENSYSGIITGVDEAGRGPWAGPVVAAAVILDFNNIPDGINDSKKLKIPAKEALYEQIFKTSKVGVAMASVEEIDSLNILQASMLAMKRAIELLPTRPDIALIDGNKIPTGLSCHTVPIIKGDALSLSIAAASIIAKVTRDRFMAQLAAEFPHYGWEKNAGYGVPIHQKALLEHGVTEHHRKSFRPVRELVAVNF